MYTWYTGIDDEKLLKNFTPCLVLSEGSIDFIFTSVLVLCIVCRPKRDSVHYVFAYGLWNTGPISSMCVVHCTHQGQDEQGFTVVRGQFLQKRDRIDSSVWNQLVSSMLQTVVLVSAYSILANSSPGNSINRSWFLLTLWLLIGSRNYVEYILSCFIEAVMQTVIPVRIWLLRVFVVIFYYHFS